MFTTFRPGRDGNIAVTLLPQVKTQTNLSWGISGDARCAICDVGRAHRCSRCSCCRDLHAVSRAAIAVVAPASYRIHRARISATARNATANKSARMSGIRAPSRVCGKIVLKARDLRRLAAARVRPADCSTPPVRLMSRSRAHQRRPRKQSPQPPPRTQRPFSDCPSYLQRPPGDGV